MDCIAPLEASVIAQRSLRGPFPLSRKGEGGGANSQGTAGARTVAVLSCAKSRISDRGVSHF